MQPLVIMMSLPFAIIGAVLGLMVAGQTANMMSLIGFTMLLGLVTKNAILLVDYANQARAKGMPLREALREACALRIRPIFMTTLSTILGMLPIALGLGAGAELRQSMGVVLVPALGQHGVNIMSFTKEFNERTKNDAGMIIPVIITVYADRSFSFVTKTPPAPVLIKKACGIESGSAVPNKTKVAKLSKADCQKIAETKMPDLNAASLEAAMSMIAGTARSMGITVEE